MNDLYLLSGLGADERVYTFIDLSGYTLHFIKWITPLENESIEAYASRLVLQVKSPKPILIGVSFGGMMAIEIGKQIETTKIIIISSAKTRNELSWLHRLTGKLGLHKSMPPELPKKSDSIMYWLFDVKLEEEKKLLKTIIEETDNEFLVWAIDKIVNWKNKTRLPNTIHIHGTNDRVIPFSNATYSIARAGHFMLVNRPREIGEIIRRELSEYRL